MTDWTVLVNPRAGRVPVSVPRVRGALAAADVKYQLIELDSAEGMRHAVVAASGDGRGVCVVGGDGTISLAVDALLKAGINQPLVAGLPAGTGCDFLRVFGLHTSMEETAMRLASPSTYEVDVGLIEGQFGRRHFVNVAQAGVGAAAAKGAARLPRSWGPVRYPMAFGGKLPRFPACEITIGSDGTPSEWRERAMAVIFCNSQYFAGGWNVAPKAMLSDGEMDVQTFTCSKLAAPGLVPKVIKGTHLQHPEVSRTSMRNFHLETEVPWPVEADGDHVGSTPIRVSVLPAAVRWKI